MRLTRLSLTDFRNHAAFDVSPSAPFIVLHGPNGAGKTNILGAVSLLVPGRGLRRAALADMAREDGQGGFAISAELGGDVQIGTGTLAQAPDRRKLRINGASAPVNSLSEWLSVLWLTPAMDRIFMEGAGARRRFLDRLTLALQPEHAQVSSRYEAAMRERNRLLGGEVRPDPAWLDAIEARMAEAALPIALARRDMVTALDIAIGEGAGGPFAAPRLTLDEDEHTGEDQLLQIWRDARPRDAAAGRTLTGPHRSDLVVHHRQSGQAAARCSTGEQKALLLSIILAHSQMVANARGAPPILLLDEVAAHLDPERRGALFEMLADGGSQVWMTGTEASLFDGISGSAQMMGLKDSI